MLQLIQSWDEAIMLFFQSIRIPALDPFFLFLSGATEAGFIWIVIALVMAIWKKNRVTSFDMLLALGLCFCLNDLVIKNIICRPRPYTVIEGLTTIVFQPTSFSFPSGHATAGFACSYALRKTGNGKGKWFFFMAAFIALSRPYVGVHYMSDTLVGVLMGLFGSMLVLWLRRKLLPDETLKKLLFVDRAPKKEKTE